MGKQAFLTSPAAMLHSRDPGDPLPAGRAGLPPQLGHLGSCLASTLLFRGRAGHFPQGGWGGSEPRGTMSCGTIVFPAVGKVASWRTGWLHTKGFPGAREGSRSFSCTSSFQHILNHPKMRLGKKA